MRLLSPLSDSLFERIATQVPSAGFAGARRGVWMGSRKVEERAASARGTVLVPMTLGEALGLLMRRAGVSGEELARRTRISTGSISNYLRDQSAPPAGVLARIVGVVADELSVDFSVLWLEVGRLLQDQVPLTRDLGAMARGLGDDPVEVWSMFGHMAHDRSRDLVASWAGWASGKLPPHTMRVYRHWLVRCAAIVRETPLDQVTSQQLYACLQEVAQEDGELVDAFQAVSHFYDWLREMTGQDHDSIVDLIRIAPSEG